MKILGEKDNDMSPLEPWPRMKTGGHGMRREWEEEARSVDRGGRYAHERRGEREQWRDPNFYFMGGVGVRRRNWGGDSRVRKLKMSTFEGEMLMGRFIRWRGIL